MKKFALTMLLAGLGTLMAADGAAVYAKCAGCHGQKGETKAMGKSAPITGQAAAKTIEQMNGYKAGTLNLYGMGAVMKGQAAAMSDADIKAVSDYIAGLK